MIKTIKDLHRLHEDYKEAMSREKMKILVCAGTGCVLGGSLRVYEALKKIIREKEYASGATKGYIYVRTEYPLAVKRLQKAIQQAREFGLLGNIKKISIQ